MKLNSRTTFLAMVMAFGVFLASIGSGAARPDESDKSPTVDDRTSTVDQEAAQTEGNSPVTLQEARGQARLLHETLHATLQVVHREYYREDEGLTIPSSMLDVVFDKLARSTNVKFRWLAVNAQAMDIDHEAQNEFEKSAVKALASGKAAFESVDNEVYRRAGRITLFSQCLKCHLPNRTSTKSRAAALVISMPIKKN